MSTSFQRTNSFCSHYGLRVPILLAPMAGASAPSLSIAVANAGGLASCGALLMQPKEIEGWVTEVRAGTNGPFQLNLWIPDPAPKRDPDHEARVRDFLAGWGPAVPPDAGDAVPPDFDTQCEALLAAGPRAVSSVMGVRRGKAALSSGCKPHPANSLPPEAIGAVMEVTKWLKPSISVSRIGDSASEQAATRVNAEQASKRTMCRPTRHPRVHASNRSDSRARPTTARLGLETGAYLSADEALKLPDLA